MFATPRRYVFGCASVTSSHPSPQHSPAPTSTHSVLMGEAEAPWGLLGLDRLQPEIIYMPQWHIPGRPALTPADRLHNVRHTLLSDVSNDGDFQKR